MHGDQDRLHYKLDIGGRKSRISCRISKIGCRWNRKGWR
jgi:hypothetical protein